MPAPDLTSYTITKGSCAGTTIQLRRISPFLVRDLQAQFPQPAPPINRVLVGPGENDYESLPNPTAPDHLRALEAHKLLLSEKLIELVAIRGVVVNFGEEQRREVVELREAMASVGVALSKHDKVVFIKYILLEDADELRNVTSLVYTASIPTEVETEKNIELFRPED